MIENFFKKKSIKLDNKTACLRVAYTECARYAFLIQIFIIHIRVYHLWKLLVAYITVLFPYHNLFITCSMYPPTP